MPLNVEKLRSLMHGHTQAQLARTLKTSQPNIHRLITGKGNPTLATLDKLAKAMGVPVGELLA